MDPCVLIQRCPIDPALKDRLPRDNGPSSIWCTWRHVVFKPQTESEQIQTITFWCSQMEDSHRFFMFVFPLASKLLKGHQWNQTSPPEICRWLCGGQWVPLASRMSSSHYFLNFVRLVAQKSPHVWLVYIAIIHLLVSLMLKVSQTRENKWGLAWSQIKLVLDI